MNPLEIKPLAQKTHVGWKPPWRAYWGTLWYTSRVFMKDHALPMLQLWSLTNNVLIQNVKTNIFKLGISSSRVRTHTKAAGNLSSPAHRDHSFTIKVFPARSHSWRAWLPIQGASKTHRFWTMSNIETYWNPSIWRSWFPSHYSHYSHVNHQNPPQHCQDAVTMSEYLQQVLLVLTSGYTCLDLYHWLIFFIPRTLVSIVGRCNSDIVLK